MVVASGVGVLYGLASLGYINHKVSFCVQLFVLGASIHRDSQALVKQGKAFCFSFLPCSAHLPCYPGVCFNFTQHWASREFAHSLKG